MIRAVLAYEGYGPECPAWKVIQDHPRESLPDWPFSLRADDIWRLEKYESFHQIENRCL